MSSWRDTDAGSLRTANVGERVKVAGWVDVRRDHGGLVFIDLRDASGVVQLVVNPERAPAAVEVAHELRNEFVISADGEVVARAPELANPNLATGEIEVQIDALEIVSRSTPLPFQLDDENVDDNVRMRYRWLDLRRPKLQRNIRLRGQMVGAIRRVMESAGFVDIQTPILWKPTPEGARDFLVPSRLQPGRFYALTAVAADREAAPRDLGLRALLPDRNLLPRRRPPRGPRAGDHAARRRDGVPGPGGHPRPDGDDDPDGVARVHRRRPRHPVSADDLRRGRPAFRLGQTRPPVRPRDRGRNGGDARVDVRRLRRSRNGALPPCAEDVLAERARDARGVREAMGCERARIRRHRRVWRDSLTDREVSLARGARSLRRPAG